MFAWRGIFKHNFLTGKSPLMQLPETQDAPRPMLKMHENTWKCYTIGHCVKDFFRCWSEASWGQSCTKEGRQTQKGLHIHGQQSTHPELTQFDIDKIELPSTEHTAKSSMQDFADICVLVSPRISWKQEKAAAGHKQEQGPAAIMFTALACEHGSFMRTLHHPSVSGSKHKLRGKRADNHSAGKAGRCWLRWLVYCETVAAMRGWTLWWYPIAIHTWPSVTAETCPVLSKLGTYYCNVYVYIYIYIIIYVCVCVLYMYIGLYGYFDPR